MTIQRYPMPRNGAHVQQAVSDTVVTLSPPTNAAGVLLQAIAADVRFTLDGTDPVGDTTGFMLYNGHPPTLVDIGAAVQIKLIRDSSTDASVAIQYMGAVS